MVGSLSSGSIGPRPVISSMISSTKVSSSCALSAMRSASTYCATNAEVLEEVDTRRLTRHLRTAGVMRGIIAQGEQPTAEVLAALDACPSMEGLDLATKVSTSQ